MRLTTFYFINTNFCDYNTSWIIDIRSSRKRIAITNAHCGFFYGGVQIVFFQCQYSVIGAGRIMQAFVMFSGLSFFINQNQNYTQTVDWFGDYCHLGLV